MVSIVTPNHLHVPVAKNFADMGINIICDKPLALTSEEAIELKNTIENKIGFNSKDIFVFDENGKRLKS